jgi:hypothetical protein
VRGVGGETPLGIEGRLKPREQGVEGMQFPGLEPGRLAELAVTDDRGTADDPGLVNSVDIRDLVPVLITDLVIRPAEHVQQAHQLNAGW